MTFHPIPGTEFPGHEHLGPAWFIDDDQQVWRMRAVWCPKEMRRMRLYLNRGYLACQVGKIHHIVLLAVKHEKRPEGSMCRHLDGNRLNNRPDNLKWGTCKENYQDSVRHGTFRKAPSSLGKTQSVAMRLAKTINHPSRKVNVEDVLEMRSFYATFKGTKPEAYKFLAAKYGVSVGLVNSILIRERWKLI